MMLIVRRLCTVDWHSSTLLYIRLLIQDTKIYEKQGYEFFGFNRDLEVLKVGRGE